MTARRTSIPTEIRQTVVLSSTRFIPMRCECSSNVARISSGGRSSSLVSEDGVFHQVLPLLRGCAALSYTPSLRYLGLLATLCDVCRSHPITQLVQPRPYAFCKRMVKPVVMRQASQCCEVVTVQHVVHALFPYIIFKEARRDLGPGMPAHFVVVVIK